LNIFFLQMIAPDLFLVRQGGQCFLREKPEEPPSAGANGSEYHKRPPADHGASRLS
jgi:hypothetical protein